jgi:hypothetical protein
MDYSITAWGWVRFHFDISGLQPNDRFAYNVGGGGFESFTGNVQIERIWDFGGNFEHSISLEMHIDGEWSNWKEYFFVPAFDTIDYEIKY